MRTVPESSSAREGSISTRLSWMRSRGARLSSSACRKIWPIERFAAGFPGLTRGLLTKWEESYG